MPRNVRFVAEGDMLLRMQELVDSGTLQAMPNFDMTHYVRPSQKDKQEWDSFDHIVKLTKWYNSLITLSRNKIPPHGGESPRFIAHKVDR